MSTGTSRTQLGELNIRAVIHALRRLGPSSQREIAEHAALSIPTVSVIVRGLEQRGTLRVVRTESNGRGRPRAVFDLVPDAAHAIGIHLDPALITVVALDMTGQPVKIAHDNSVDPDDPHSTLATAAGMVEQVLEDAQLPDADAVQCALAVPGRIDPTHGAIADSVWLPHWNGVPVAGILGDRLHRDVPLLKDTFAAMSGEIWVRGGELLDATSIFVYHGTGTGLGIAVDGRAVPGQSGNVGQAGRLFELLSSPGHTEAATAHDPADVVTTALAEGLLENAAGSRSPDPRHIGHAFRQLCALAETRDERALSLLQSAGDRIHRVAAVAADVLDAGFVILGGPYWELVRDLRLPHAEETIGRPAQHGRAPVRVLASALGQDAGAVGAASVVLDRRFR